MASCQIKIGKNDALNVWLHMKIKKADPSGQPFKNHHADRDPSFNAAL